MKNNQLAIFIKSGKLKGKAIYYNSSYNLRPIKSIIRKILFCWFNFIINKSYVLDLFAGTGVIGFEFISRGANYVLMLDINRIVYDNIISNKTRLDVKLMFNIKNIDAYKWLDSKIILNFNIIILDPPYVENFLISCFIKINDINMFFNSLFIYFECNASSFLFYLPYNWILLKKVHLGRVYCYLLKRLK